MFVSQRNVGHRSLNQMFLYFACIHFCHFHGHFTHRGNVNIRFQILNLAKIIPNGLLVMDPLLFVQVELSEYNANDFFFNP